MVHVLARRDFEQELYEKAPKQYVGPDGGSNPAALGLTDRGSNPAALGLTDRGSNPTALGLTDRGSNPTALGLTDRLVCTQSISIPGWNKLVNNTGVVG